ncbi:Outer membrane cobalamin receptor protein [Candidatus Ornithobacterium hominis]|uniref:SusC/RagA family TonB-linked outer membrane protein n=1 Tax=Candidatus Ornithobacterium hominis TaxID=2497989 RepID=UPI0024BC0D2A|nr:TonB-dependent receptor [Candidatus Ornithobacterium hominis]CAI9428720.1 Outer membrane cobalamin receptor protein [Candidatus Ornithobacterium hominis]
MRKNVKKLLSVAVFCLAIYGFGQEKTVTGQVLDSDGFPVQDAFVHIEGESQGVYTDENGNYTISVEAGDVVVVEYIGMETKSVTIGAKNTYDLKLTKGGAIVLKDVVAVGYGSQSLKDVTGAITSISAEELENKPVASVEQALQGKSPGLQIVNTAGRAGSQVQMSIRGNGSLRASNDVLYVIDGVPQESMSHLTNEDIKSISVLKDAASAAIYGSRASNGVILIETKRGGYGENVKIQISSSRGWQSPVGLPKLLDATQYKKIHDVARTNYEADIASGVLKAPKDPAVLTPMAQPQASTDWLNQVLRNAAIVENHQISVSGGGESTRAYLSGSFFNQEGIIKQDSYKKGRLRLNVEQKITEFLSTGINSYFSYSSATPIADDNNTYQPWNNAIQAPPIYPVYGNKGKPYRGNFKNPLWAFEREVASRWQTVGGQFYFDLTPLAGLTWHSSFSGNIDNERYNRFDAPNTKRGENGDGVPTGYGRYSTKNNRNYQIENTLTYDNKFFENNLSLNFLAGHTYQHWDYEDSYLEGEKFPSDDLRWLVSAGEINKGRSYILSIGLESFFSRLQLNWSGKYLLMLSARADGSTKFAKGNKWGVFPAASAGWVISEEPFFNSSTVNLFKLRGSYGLTGNQSGISYAVGQNLLTGGQNYDLQPGLAATDVYNPDLKWEVGYSTNIGLDLTLFDRLNLSLDLYKKTTKDLLNRINIPQESGFRTMLKNIGEISNKGFEVSTNLDIYKYTDFKWNIAANFSYNENKIKDLGLGEVDYYTTGFVSVLKEGGSLGSFYLLESLGVAKEKYEYKDANGAVTKVVQAGDMIYKDQNGDGKIDDNDRKVYSGGIAPIYGGVSTSISYKGFDLSIAGQYSVGKKLYAMYKEGALNGGAVGHPSFSENMLTQMLDYWSPKNPNAANPRPHLSSAISSWNTQRSTRYLEDADYFRISDITVGFNLTSIPSLKLGFIEKARIYVQARNPFTFTKYSGVDPEVQYLNQGTANNQNESNLAKTTSGVDYNGIPNIKSINVGLNINF